MWTSRALVWKASNIGVVLLFLFFLKSGCTALNDGDDLRFTKEEREVLDKIKANSSVMSWLTDDYMKTDFYLIRFVRVAQGDFEEAVELIDDTMAWRTANNVSGVLYEDWTDLLTLFPAEYTARDKVGRPAIQVVAEYWDVREEVYYGDADRLNRFTIYILERAMHEILRSQRDGHSDVTRFIFLADADGIGLSKHFCFSCVPFAADFIHNYQTHYPKVIDQIVFTNSSFVLPLALNIVWPFMSEETRSLIQSFSSGNNDTCMAYLDERVERSQRLPEFGGTRLPTSPLTLSLLKHSGDSGSSPPCIPQPRRRAASFMAYLEYVVVFFLGMVISLTCVCLVRLRNAKRRATQYARCQAEENGVKVNL